MMKAKQAWLARRHEGRHEGQHLGDRSGRRVDLHADGEHLGTIATGVPTANFAWGDDGATLYITANMRCGG